MKVGEHPQSYRRIYDSMHTPAEEQTQKITNIIPHTMLEMKQEHYMKRKLYICIYFALTLLVIMITINFRLRNLFFNRQ